MEKNPGGKERENLPAWAGEGAWKFKACAFLISLFPSHRESVQIEMVMRALQLLPSLMICNSEVETEVGKYFRYISTLWAKVTGSGNKGETKWKRISTIFPIGRRSKFSFEVLRLGLVWVQSENFHQGTRGYPDQAMHKSTPSRIRGK